MDVKLKLEAMTGRPCLVQRYTDKVARLVQNTSYSEVISKLRKELG